MQPLLKTLQRGQLFCHSFRWCYALGCLRRLRYLLCPILKSHCRLLWPDITQIHLLRSLPARAILWYRFLTTERGNLARLLLWSFLCFSIIQRCRPQCLQPLRPKTKGLFLICRFIAPGKRWLLCLHRTYHRLRRRLFYNRGLCLLLQLLILYNLFRPGRHERSHLRRRSHHYRLSFDSFALCQHIQPGWWIGRSTIARRRRQRVNIGYRLIFCLSHRILPETSVRKRLRLLPTQCRCGRLRKRGQTSKTTRGLRRHIHVLPIGYLLKVETPCSTRGGVGYNTPIYWGLPLL